MSKIFSYWQRSRQRWNHDWLKNRWIPALSAYGRVLAGQVADDGMMDEIRAGLVEDFVPGCAEVRHLVERFPSEMSPRRLFEIPPLCSCDVETLEWLPEITEVLWIHRHQVDVVTRQALTQIEQMESAARALLRSMDEHEPFDRLHLLSQELIRACSGTAATLSRLPSAPL